MRIRDLHDERNAGGWDGLGIEVDAPVRPRVRVEYAPGGLLRFSCDERPFYWCRWHGGFDGFSWLRAQEVPSILPPIPLATAREAAGSAPRWARMVAQMLADAGVLHRGTWELRPVGARSDDPSALSVREPERALEPIDGDRWDWDVDGGGWLLGLRRPSPAGSARVKAWRKAAREGVLPPLVIEFVSLLDSWLLLDGHDRLLAATLEGLAPQMISVPAVREQPIHVERESQNRLYEQLERRFGNAGPLDPSTARSLDSTFFAKFPPKSFTVSRTRAWPIPGGRDGWIAEVKSRLGTAHALGTETRILPA